MTNGEDLIKLDDLEFLADGVGRRENMSLIAFTLPSTPRSVQVARYTEHGRGLRIVDVLSARWGWQPQGPGKAVYAILTMADGRAAHTAAKDVLEQVEARRANPMASKTDVTASARLLAVEILLAETRTAR